ncbi:MAG TPA: FAD/NAD(P)-binding protein [Pseudobdellovibrionaceae bacterium]|jgi:uncharacterized NAD(P)/FAD-binding protein YdhS
MKSHVVIIGGGLSGVLVSLELARLPQGPEVTLIEKNPEHLGRGVAYDSHFTHQPLNVIAGGMSLFPDKPMDFVEWLKKNHFKYKHLVEQVSSQEFIPRKIFGDYVLENLQRVQRQAGGRLQIRIGEAISIVDFGERKKVILHSGHELLADQVILALGNFPPGDLFPEEDSLQKNPHYYANPWSDKVYSHIEGNENLLLVGAGLTAVDIVLGLILRKFKGKVTLLSRRGRWPLSHDLSHPVFQFAEPEIQHPRKMLLWLRQLIRKNPQVPWPSVMDGLRPFTKKIWIKWSIDEKKYFLKRLKPYWEIARHRIPTKSIFQLKEMKNLGQLELKKGCLLNVQAAENGIEVVYRSQNKECRQIFQKVINCTGPELNYRKVHCPLIHDLLKRGKIKTDELGLGLECTPEGQILNVQGKIEQGFWCIGPMRKAVLWETTALCELREQASELVSLIYKKGLSPCSSLEQSE